MTDEIYVVIGSDFEEGVMYLPKKQAKDFEGDDDYLVRPLSDFDIEESTAINLDLNYRL